VGADLPDESDVPPDGHADRRDDDQSGDGSTTRPGGTEAETRSRQECYDDLRAVVSTKQSATARRIAAEEQAAADEWNEKVTESRWMWTEYQRKWPPEERRPVDRSSDPQGSWRGDRDRFLDPVDNGRVEAECDRIAKREEQELSPAMRAIEGQDPARHMIGFDDRLKGRGRIKEKVYDTTEERGRSLEDAVSMVPDAIRYTFQYRETYYTQGVWADTGRLKEQGFELHSLWNAWSDDQYKGINSQWIEPDSGQRFEVQFHTRISYEAKQLTHDAYERLRTYPADKFEQMVLEAFQKKVSAEVPIPPGATDIPDYP
jgi:hypothetical protein